MRLVSFLAPAASTSGAGEVRTGVMEGDAVVDLTDPVLGLPNEMTALFGTLNTSREIVERAPNSRARRWPLSEVTLRAPVAQPPKVLAIGMNYQKHVAEVGQPAPQFQYWFNKQRTCIVGSGEPILVPEFSEQVDYEGELAVVIGRYCRDVPQERALEVVAGYTVINDVSVRDWQLRTPTFTMGKSFDTHGPLGPWIVTKDEIPDPQDLRLRTWVNDDLRQDESTSDMIFNCSEMIAYLTSVFSLEPGDVLATGTPSGVAMARVPPPWLRPGDQVRVEIEGLGVLENPVEAGRAPHPVGLD